MKSKTLQDLYVDELKDLYNAENQLIHALPKMVKAAQSPELQDAFWSHLKQTEEHAQRIEKIASAIGVSPKGKKCVGMEGVISEGKEVMEEEFEEGVMDTALIAAAQRVEHYEMAGYGCARAMAETLGYGDAVDLLQQTLDEEKEADQKLTQIAQTLASQYVA
jgi:ferritin-like metal-binding protein YciE